MGSSSSVSTKNKQEIPSSQLKEQDFVYEHFDNETKDIIKHFTFKLNKDKTFQADIKDYLWTNPDSGYYWDVNALIKGHWEQISTGIKFIVNDATYSNPNMKLTNDWSFLEGPAKELTLQWECNGFKPGDQIVKGLGLNGYDDSVFFKDIPLKRENQDKDRED